MAATPVAASLTCAACGMTWDVPAKPDGSLPQGARCPTAAGGCGKFARVPRAAAHRTARAGAGWPTVWEPEDLPAPVLRPVTGPDGNPVTDDCGAPLYWEPSGTLQACADPDCPEHEEPVFPPSLLPRERPSDPRRVATRDEVLDQALALAGQREQLLGWIDGHLAGTRLTPATRGHLGVFRAEIQQAGDAERLAWLASRLGGLPVRELPAAQPQAVRGEVIRELPHPAAQDTPEPMAGQHAGSVYRPCERCRNLGQRGPDGRWAAAAVRVEIASPWAQNDLCPGCLALLKAQHEPGTYSICERYWQVA